MGGLNSIHPWTALLSPARGSVKSCTCCLLFKLQKVEKTGAVGRLTDTSRYTGSHKERFDDSGKGRGREGREELVENTGYVGAYKNAGTYDEKMKVNKWVPLHLFQLCRILQNQIYVCSRFIFIMTLMC